MRNASIDSYTAAVAALKKRHACKRCTIFLDANAIRAALQQKRCLLHAGEHALFLLVPYHDTFYDCLYLASDDGGLEQELDSMLRGYDEPLSLRISAIGKEPATGKTATVFSRLDFTLAKQIMRLETLPPPESLKKAMLSLAAQYASHVGFAEERDAPEILALLLEEFDIYGDSVPEYSAIVENIKKKQVIVLKIDGSVASVNYFEIINNIFHGIFGATRKEYRSSFLFLSILEYTEKYLNKEMNISKCLAWRDMSSKRLIKYAKNINERQNGVYVYHFYKHNIKKNSNT